MKPFADDAALPDWVREAVYQAAAAGIIEGYPDGSFAPTLPVTRAEMAVMLARAIGLRPSETALPRYADAADVPDWAKEAVAGVYEAGLMTGRDGGYFAPRDFATRAEAAVLLLRVNQD
ncbi:S-layer homology domain-containing protein [Paenibacillus planticolens]|uniref:S-layer homology domain-containing protein n=1 Tax=Paenibacillus planticolens TaxID=2654976 RepID=UPI0028B1809C|nr:S-layer homology domain-containing protein [Paenibacillus planticolens]